MIETIAGALLPAVVTILLGYLAARHHEFGPHDAPILNRMVMTYALPLAIFVGTVSTNSAALSREVPLLVALSVAILGVYGAVFLVCRFGLRFSLGVSALAALAAAAPNAPFIGTGVLTYLYGATGGLPVAISSIVINITVVPATVIFLAIDASGHAAPQQPLASSTVPAPSQATSPRPELTEAIATAFKEPIVWLPLLGVVMVLVGLPVPALAADALALLGHSAAGVALFSSGIVLAGYRVRLNSLVVLLVTIKNVVQPALVWVGLLAMGYADPLLSEAVVTAALPMLVIVAMLGVQFQVAETEVTSALVLSMVCSLITLGAFIGLTGG
ncbi:MAG TPA: AEC family transporter [Thermomicrobiales bacterium]|nr:AEC family transporter [Thermomicrobiales bacterium]